MGKATRLSNRSVGCQRYGKTLHVNYISGYWPWFWPLQESSHWSPMPHDLGIFEILVVKFSKHDIMHWSTVIHHKHPTKTLKKEVVRSLSGSPSSQHRRVSDQTNLENWTVWMITSIRFINHIKSILNWPSNIYSIRRTNMFAYRTLWFPSFPFGFAQHRPVWLELRNIQELQGGAKKISPPGLVFQTCRL